MKAQLAHPKSGYMEITNLSHKYKLTEHWCELLIYYKADLEFHRSLLKKYYPQLSQGRKIKYIQEVEILISKTLEDLEILSEQAKKHILLIDDLMGDLFMDKGQNFYEKHVNFENKLITFYSVFQILKSKINIITRNTLTEVFQEELQESSK